MKALLGSVVVIALAGCSKTSTPTKAHGPVEAPTAHPAARPAAVSDELVKMYDRYASAFDKITRDIARAGSDCEQAADNVERDVASLQLPTAAQLLAQMGSGSHDVEVWLGETYGPRFKASAMRLAPMEKACSTNAHLRAAMSEAASKFPMMRKKHG